MIQKILIANRGEIALRILRACHKLGIKTVAVHSTVDRQLPHVKMADESVCIGSPDPKKSYLNIPSIISAAELTNADAIHPGYGFLAENADFSKICKENDFVFIGPDPDIINSMGNKSMAKATMTEAGVPVIPGSEDILTTVEECDSLAKNMGYPVMLKASAGGGGKGMRMVTEKEGMSLAFRTAKAESESAFGNGDLYLEKFIETPRHIEVQILADSFGNVIHLGERECSIQRRHQKLVEESPSPIVDESLRKTLGDTAVQAGKKVNYVGVGTVEFLVDKNLNCYFMEMNTRIQVEHPVTEMVTGIDIVGEQIKIAQGKELNIYQDDIQTEGHSIEARIYAEDPDNNFLPSTGKLIADNHTNKDDIRWDTGVEEGIEIGTDFDPSSTPVSHRISSLFV
jgi:acetyl-CoA carboxylase biotin carboxylase subunit